MSAVDRPLPGEPGYVAQPNVQQAWAAVMAEVQGLGKHQRTDSGNRFNFRGVDDVMNAVGPVLRKHGVSVVPTAVTHAPEDVTTTKGARMRNVTVVVSYAIHGPAGDTMPGAAAGEAADSGDKATPKAMSVAFRTFLLQSLCLPTDEPDPDQHQYERSAEPTPQQQAQRVADGLPSADAAALERVRGWSADHNLLAVEVQYQSDDGPANAPLGSLLDLYAQRLGVAA